MEEKWTKEFEEVLLQTVGGTTALFLMETTFKDDKVVGTAKKSEKIIEKCKTYFQFASKYTYMTLEFAYEKEPELKSVLFSFKQYLDASTKVLTKAQEKYYTFMASLSKVENGMAYVMELKNPIFCFQEGSKVIFIFENETLTFGKFGMDMEDINQEVEYEVKARAEVLANENEYLNSDSTLHEIGATDDL